MGGKNLQNDIPKKRHDKIDMRNTIRASGRDICKSTCVIQYVRASAIYLKIFDIAKFRAANRSKNRCGSVQWFEPPMKILNRCKNRFASTSEPRFGSVQMVQFFFFKFIDGTNIKNIRKKLRWAI